MNNDIDILVVEDSPTQAEQLRYLLGQRGYQVSVAYNGREALASIRQRKPTLVLSDIVMPEMDGFELCRAIRDDQDLKDIPVILLTSLSDPRDVIRALECGASNFITKPYEEKYLLSRIRHALTNQELRKNAKMEMGVNIFFAGEQHFITAERLQILDLLLATYETAVHENHELARTRDELQRLNERLEEIVAERTAALTAEVAEHRRKEEELTRLSMAVEQAAESIVITDPDATILYVNPAFERITGYGREEAVGQNPRILKSGRHDAAFYRRMWETIGGGETWSGHLLNRRKDGSLFEEEAVISPVRDPAGKIVNYVAVKRDVTQEVALEAQLHQAQKMEAIGTLAGGVAHDFNNVLTGIIGFAQLALMEESLSPQARDCIARIPAQGKQAANLIAQLLTFSRKAAVERQPLQLIYLIKETIKMLQRTLPESISIKLHAPGGVWPVNADPTQMQQVLMNLCFNAGHAMPEGGTLSAGLENVTLDEAYCQMHIEARPGRYVCLTVRDTGAGMSPEVREHIFEPFFTTKRAGEGTGLGLSTVYGIVKSHEGFINVYSEVGKGSEFKVYLPAMEGAKASREGVEERPPVGGAETLLLVEDEEMVREAGQRILESLGYTVLAARDGEEAIEVYRAHRNEIALVLTDTVMPRMGGEELYEALRQIDPTVRTLLMSGYSLSQGIDDLQAKGLKGFVQKPFDLHRLAQAVRQALDDPSA